MERLLDYFKPNYYDLELFVFSEKEYIQGTSRIGGEIIGDTVKFHAVGMDIKEVSFEALYWYNRGDSDDFFEYQNLTEKEESEHNCEYSYDGETITIPISDTMKARLARVHKVNMEDDYEDRCLAAFTIKYETKLNHNMQGCYVSTYEFNGKVQKLVATQFESHYAREAFPCIDEPAAKACFNLTLVVPDRKPVDVVLANIELVKQDINRFEFATTPRMSTYLLAWVIGPLKSVSAVNDGGIKVTSYAALNQPTSSLEFANEVACRALDYYEDKFGVLYPLSKLDQVALPDFEAGAMENWGLVTYRESCMLAEPNASIDTKQSVAITITHELSHQWFGDLVTMQWWDDLWLNESFATVMEYYATDALYPELNAWQDFFTSDCVSALRRDMLPGVQSVQQEVHDPAEIATLFDSAIVYAKGARLVLMLMHLMGEDNFYKGLHYYFVEYKYSNTIGDNLWEQLQPYADFDIKKFMHAWISQPGYPMLWKDGDSYAQRRFLIDNTTDDTKWPLPEVKDDMSGHYIIKLDDTDLSEKLNNYNELSIEERLRILIDRMLLAKTKYVESTSLLNLLPKSVDEEDTSSWSISEEASVWSILLDIINDLKIFFKYNTAEEKLYQEFLRDIIYVRIRDLGVEPKPSDNNDVKRLRNILLVIARFAQDEEIIEHLADLYQDDLSEIDAEMRGNILMAKLMLDDSEIFDDLLSKYQSENNPEIKDDILCTLASTRNDTHIQRVIDLLNQPDIVRPQDHLFLYIYLLRNPKARPHALGWLYSHWDEVVKMTGEKSVEDYPRCTANFIYTREEADIYYKFFDKFSDNPVLKRTIITSRAGIEARLQLISADAPAVHAKIKLLTKE